MKACHECPLSEGLSGINATSFEAEATVSFSGPPSSQPGNLNICPREVNTCGPEAGLPRGTQKASALTQSMG